MVEKRDLTDKNLKALQPAPVGKRYFAWDAQIQGFGVRVTDRKPPDKSRGAGSISFVLVARFGGAKHPAPRQIGEWPSMALASARQIAREWREDIDKGIDPKAKAEAAREAKEAERREEERKAANTFEAAFGAYAEDQLSKLRTGKVVEGVVKKHVLPALGKRPLGEITRAEANDMLKKIAKRTPTHARRIRSYLQTFGRWCEDDDRVTESPFASLKRLGTENARERVLTDLEIRAIWNATAQLGAFGRAIRLMLVTGQRRSEVGDMQWREIDEAKRLWTLPRTRTKADREHEVPLSPLALAILADCPDIGVHVFATRAPTARDGAPKSKVTTTPPSGWSKAKARLDELATEELRKLTGDEIAEFADWHLHDLRRTCATHLARLRVERVVISKILNHAEGGVTRIYDRFAYLPQKRGGLDAWSEQLTRILEGRPYGENRDEIGEADNVISFVARG